VLYLRVEIGPPPAEIVVNVDRGNVCLSRPLLEFRDAFGHRQSEFDELLRLREIEVVDDVDEE
jgi:hypothetical protein